MPFGNPSAGGGWGRSGGWGSGYVTPSSVRFSQKVNSCMCVCVCMRYVCLCARPRVHGMSDEGLLRASAAVFAFISRGRFSSTNYHECCAPWQLSSRSSPQYSYSEAPVPWGGRGGGVLHSHQALGGGGPPVRPPWYSGRSSGSSDTWNAVMDRSYHGIEMRIRIL